MQLRKNYGKGCAVRTRACLRQKVINMLFPDADGGPLIPNGSEETQRSLTCRKLHRSSVNLSAEPASYAQIPRTRPFLKSFDKIENHRLTDQRILIYLLTVWRDEKVSGAIGLSEYPLEVRWLRTQDKTNSRASREPVPRIWGRLGPALDAGFFIVLQSERGRLSPRNEGGPTGLDTSSLTTE